MSEADLGLLSNSLDEHVVAHLREAKRQHHSAHDGHHDENRNNDRHHGDGGRHRLMSRFSVQKSTQQLYAGDGGDQDFYGAYGHERRKLDYSCHRHYRKERQWLHDAIIDSNLQAQSHTSICNTPTNPWLLFMVGAPGAGKRYTIQWLVEHDHLPLLAFTLVDPEELRRHLPEFTSYARHVPNMLHELTKHECSYLAETLTLAALHQGRNVILDGAWRRDAHWYMRYITFLRNEFPTLCIGMLVVRADWDTIARRAEQHGQVTGWTMPWSLIQDMCQGLDELMAAVRPHADATFVFANIDEPKLENKDGWSTFAATFEQTTLAQSKQRMQRNVSADEKQEAHGYSITRMSMTRRKCFSIHKSTEENHKSDEMKFFGPFAHIRETIDYDYHANYTFERQRFQDFIIHDFLDTSVLQDQNGEICTTPTEPWAVFTAGAMGSGKSWTMKRLVRAERFPLLAFVNVDPDEIRRKMPEFHLYVHQRPEMAGELTRKEAGFIAEILTVAGLQSGKNVLVDSSLRDSLWYPTYFARLRQKFTILRISIIHVTAPREQVFQRAASRALTTGRVVPKTTLVESIVQVPKSVSILRHHVDYFAEIRNDSRAEDVELVTEGETWESFQRQWLQTCAWVPDRKEMTRKSKEARVAHGLDND